MAFFEAFALALLLQTPAADAPAPPPTELIMQDAGAIRSQAPSAFAQSLLNGFGCLQPPAPTAVYYNKETRKALSEAEAAKMTEAQLAGYAKKDIDLSLIHISEPTRLLSISYAVFCLKKKKN